MKVPASFETWAKRFWTYVQMGSPSSCWRWTGSTSKTGYGYYGLAIYGQKHVYKAHRVAFALANGHIDSWLEVNHSCDNPWCCNPQHLKQGTHDDNMRDRSVRERTGRTSLTHGEVRELRKIARYHRIPSIIRVYGLSRAIIYRAIVGTRYLHV